VCRLKTNDMNCLRCRLQIPYSVKYGTFIGAEWGSDQRAAASKCPYKRKATLEGVDNFLGTELKEDSVIQKATVGTPSRQLCEVYNKSD